MPACCGRLWRRPSSPVLNLACIKNFHFNRFLLTRRETRAVSQKEERTEGLPILYGCMKNSVTFEQCGYFSGTMCFKELPEKEPLSLTIQLGLWRKTPKGHSSARHISWRLPRLSAVYLDSLHWEFNLTSGLMGCPTLALKHVLRPTLLIEEKEFPIPTQFQVHGLAGHCFIKLKPLLWKGLQFHS